MNKPAPKEPSMDEILSSIRQIIADDDASGNMPRRPASPSPLNQAAPMGLTAPRAMNASPPDPVAAADGSDAEPLALSVAQILAEDEIDEAVAGPIDLNSFLADDEAEEGAEPPPAEFVDPEDIAFETEDELEAEPLEILEPQPLPPPKPVFSIPARTPVTEPRPQVSVAVAAPMPDLGLSADIAEQLIEPATNAAVRGTFAKLSNLGLGNQGLTIEMMMRDMLRPMLKEWLDENLPAVVERMVEKEIARISRGID